MSLSEHKHAHILKNSMGPLYKHVWRSALSDLARRLAKRRAQSDWSGKSWRNVTKLMSSDRLWMPCTSTQRMSEISNRVLYHHACDCRHVTRAPALFAKPRTLMREQIIPRRVHGQRCPPPFGHRRMQLLQRFL
jgi:hypothetical protein